MPIAQESSSFISNVTSTGLNQQAPMRAGLALRNMGGNSSADVPIQPVFRAQVGAQSREGPSDSNAASQTVLNPFPSLPQSFDPTSQQVPLSSTPVDNFQSSVSHEDPKKANYATQMMRDPQFNGDIKQNIKDTIK